MSENKKILYTSFNQYSNNSYFLIGTKEGCTIYQTDPFKKGFDLSKSQLKNIILINLFKYIDIKGEFSMVRMYKSSNIFGIVRANNNKELGKRELIIWDDKNQKIIYKYKFKTDIINFELTEDYIVVVLYSKIYVFDVTNFQIVDIIKTGSNPKGLVGFSHKKGNMVVYPSTEDCKGKITIKNYESKSYIYLNPDENEVVYFTLSYDGLFLATFSKKSNKIRIYEASTGKLLDELPERDDVKFLSIKNDNYYIFFSQKRDNIDIWSLVKANKIIGKTIDEDNEVTNVHKGFIHKRDIQFNQVNLMDKKSQFEYEFITFGNKNNLFIITSNGKLHKVIFEKKKKGTSTDVEKNNLF